MINQKKIYKQVGKYFISLLDTLGEGSYGTVYLGFKVDSIEKIDQEQPFAIKIINIGPNVPEQTSLLKIESIKKEVTSLLEIQNKNIVKLHDYFLTNNNIYLAYEYCDGGDLSFFRNQLETNYLSEAQTLLFMQHICNGYKELIAKNLIHRDLKPSNILLHKGEARIADFGSSRKCDILMTQGVGSCAYMAPEVRKGNNYDNKCDVWSFGVLVYELLYGALPWDASKGEFQLINKIMTIPLTFPKFPKRSRKMKRLLRQMLEIDANKRICWEDLINYVENFDLPQNPEIIKTTEKITNYNRRKPIIGEINRYKETSKKEIKNQTKADNDIKKTELAGIDADKKCFIVKNHLSEQKKKMLEVKKYIDEIYFLRNLSSFYLNCYELLQLASQKKLIANNLKEKILEMLIMRDHIIIKKSNDKIYELSKTGLQDEDEKKDLLNEISLEYKEWNAEVFDLEKKFQSEMKPLLLEFLQYVWIKFLKTINEEEKTLDLDFMKLVKFFYLVAISKDEQDILNEIEVKSLIQKFYLFFDKYDNMKPKKLLEIIKTDLKKLFEN